MSDERVRETSGLVASGSGLWLHNDSGDAARLFRLGRDGAVEAEVPLDALARDWEDLAGFIRAGEPWLVVGDIGDNPAARGNLRLLVLPEPTRDDLVVPTVREVALPGGQGHDAESLLVTPDGEETCVVTKAFEPEALVLCGGAPDALTALEERGRLDVRRDSDESLALFTAGDVSHDGRLVALRTYRTIRVWERAEGASLAATLARPADCVFEPEREVQGEAIAFEADGSAILSLSEGTGQTLWRYPLR